MKKVLSSIFVLALLLPSLPLPVSAVSSHAWTTSEDFSFGVHSNTSSIQSEGDVTLESLAGGVTDTSTEAFDSGTSLASSTNMIRVNDVDGGEVSLSQEWHYNILTTPAIAHNTVNHSFLDSSAHLLYLATSGGLSVINTQGTKDAADDTLVKTYTTGTTPAIGNNFVRNAFLDSSTDLLYVSTWGGGLTVINTQGTVDASDDTLVKTYTTGTTPAIVSNNTYHSFLDSSSNLLYVGTSGGLSVINTQGTVDASDDTLVKTYTTGTTPAIGNNFVTHSSLDSSTDLLYVSTWGGGLTVINTQGTVDASDDTLVKTYTTGTTPAIGNNYVYSSSFDSSSNLLYVNTSSGGLSVINTQGTVDASDDTLVKTYTTSTTPALDWNSVTHSFLDSSSNLLYVGTNGGGLSVINTQGTVDASDDTLVKTYAASTTPSIGNNSALYFFIDSSANLLYVSTGGSGLFVVDLEEEYVPTSSFQSLAQEIANVPGDLLSFNRTQAEDQTTALRYRTGESDAVWRNDFDDNDASEYVGDFYGWGAPFQDAVESGGTLRISNPSANGDTYSWFDTGKADEYFPVGSIVKARVRINSQREQQTYSDWMFNDEWSDSSTDSFINNEWQIMDFVSTTTFSKFGFNIVWQAGTWDNNNDSVEIDWVQIETPHSFGQWSDWSDACTDNTSCPVDQDDLTGKEWIQYRLDLTSSDPTSAPSVNSVTFSEGYQSAGTFTSEELSFSDTNDLLTFTADADTPTGTSLSYEYTLDQGVTWNDIDSAYTFPSDFKANSFQWRATFSSTDPLKTPILHGVTVTSTESDLGAFSNETKKLTVNEEDVSFRSENYTKEKQPKIGATNPKAKNGSVAIYEKTKNGRKKVKTISLDEDGSWHSKLPKSKEGTKQYALRYTDQAGNETSLSKYFSVTRDFTEPVFTKPLPATIALSRGGRMDFIATDIGTGIENYKLQWKDSKGHIIRSWKKQKNSFYVIPTTLQSGIYMLSIRATDKAGNSVLQVVKVTIK